MPNLDFEGHNTLYATHGLHPFPAKCPPQLVQYALRYYSKPGDLVLDPMAGSGTTLVEARILGRHCIGVEIDPVACLIARAKSTILRDEPIALASAEVIRRATGDLARIRASTAHTALVCRATPPRFHNCDYWFSGNVAKSLSILAYHIEHIRIEEQVRDFLWAGFSSLILARTSVANARDIIHSRHHHFKHDASPNVLDKFERRMERMRSQMADFRSQCGEPCNVWADVRRGDARRLRLQEASVDLVFTSPPYATALDYPRAHFLVVPWMESALGIDLDHYMAAGQTYIGSERGRLPADFEMDRRLAGLGAAERVLGRLQMKSPRYAKLTQRYFLDMQRVLAETFRVLKPGCHAVLVVCPSNIRRVAVPTHDIFVEMAKNLGFRMKRRYVRRINENRRLLPYMSKFGDRMSTEYVLVLQRP